MGVCARSLRGVVLLAALLYAGHASADLAKQARDLYMEGRKAYEAGEYQKAYDDFRQSYALSQQPALLYNVASALQGLGRPHDAAETLRLYLKLVPSDPDRPMIEERINTLEEAQRLLDRDRPKPVENPAPQTPPPAKPIEKPQAETPPVEKPPAEPPAPEEDPTQHRGRLMERAGIGVAVVGGAALIGGLAASLLAKGNSDAVAEGSRNGSTFVPSQQRNGRAEMFAADALYAIGGAAVIVGAAVAIVGHRARTHSARAQVTPLVGPRHAGAGVSGSF
jgi:tetratricopeptide (TPR) repeat protein